MDYRDFELQISREGPDQYRARALKDGDTVASQIFELRVGGVRLFLGLEQLEKGAIGPKSKETFHIEFGHELYTKVFSGELGVYFKDRFEEALDDGAGLRLSLRFGADAAEIAALPWEFLHSEEDFLVTKRDLLISRLPAEVRRRKFKPLETTLRMLVVVSTPNDPNLAPLNTELEQEVILEAADRLQQENRMVVDFSEDATYETVQGYLNEKEYQVFHFTGHGSYHDGKGHLIFEKEDGTAREIDSRAIADLLAGRGVRLVVLSACQSAKASNKEAYADLASVLAKEGIPAVVAMQYPIFDLSATNFASSFYRPLAGNKPVDLALTEARVAMKNAVKSNGVDFATPLLYLSDPDCLNLGEIRPETSEIITRPEMLGELQVMKKGFVGREKELRILQKGFTSDVKRAAIIYGIGGIGKTVLATRLALRMNRHFAGVFGTKCRKTTAAEEILDELNTFLLMDGVDQLNRVIHAQVPLKVKTQTLVNILNQLRYLLIFDNFEDCLDEKDEIGDPDLRGFVKQLLNGIHSNTKIIFTTRHNFDPLEGRLIADVEHISLPELPFPQAVRLMNNHLELADLDTKKKLEIYKSVGGNPWTIGQFAVHAAVESVDGLLLELEPLKRRMVEFTLLDKSYSKLDEEARRLLLCASVYDEAVTVEALSWIMGNGDNPSPSVGDEVKWLLDWGLLAKHGELEKKLYSIHKLVSEFASKELEKEGLERKLLLIRAAQHYENLFKTTENPWDLLRARGYYYQADEWTRAADIVEFAHHFLVMWGHIELATNLLNQSLKTLSDAKKAVAMGSLADIYHKIGELKTALVLCEDAKEIFEKHGYDIGTLCIYQKMGEIYKEQGKYDAAIEQYRRCINIEKKLDDEKAKGIIYHGLAGLFWRKCKYNEAIDLYEKSFKIAEKVGSDDGISSNLFNIGCIYLNLCNYDKALEYYDKCSEIAIKRHDKSTIADLFHNMSIIYERKCNYTEAIRGCHESLKIKRELQDKRGISFTLLQLGNICTKKGDYDDAIEYYNECLKISQSLEDRGNIAIVLHNLGFVYEHRGELKEAIKNYTDSLDISNKLGHKDGALNSTFQLGNICLKQLDFERAEEIYANGIEIAEELGAKAIKSKIFHNYGIIKEHLGEYEDAISCYNKSLNISEELGHKDESASTYYQLARFYERHVEYYPLALENYFLSIGIFRKLNDPNLSKAENAFSELNKKMGEEAFEKALEEIRRRHGA